MFYRQNKNEYFVRSNWSKLLMVLKQIPVPPIVDRHELFIRVQVLNAKANKLFWSNNAPRIEYYTNYAMMYY